MEPSTDPSAKSVPSEEREVAEMGTGEHWIRYSCWISSAGSSDDGGGGADDDVVGDGAAPPPPPPSGKDGGGGLPLPLPPTDY